MSLTGAPTARELSPSESVIESVAAHEGVDPVELDDSLFDAIDPDALDALVRSAAEGPNHSPVCIEFTYHGYEVSVRSDGTVDVSPVPDVLSA